VNLLFNIMKNTWPTKKLCELVIKALPIIFLGMIAAFIFVFGVFIFDKIFIQTDLDYINNAIGAFMGAFFAFLFIRISEVFTKIYERKKRHNDALVKLEYIYNEYLNIISDNIFIIDDFIGISQDAIQKNQPFIYFNNLHQFPINKEIILDLYNIDLINEVFSFNSNINKINDSIDAVNRAYAEIKNIFIQKQIDYKTYEINVNMLIKKFQEIKKFLVALTEEDKEVIAMIRILLERKPLLIHLKEYFSDKLKKQIPEEIKKIEKEINTVETKDKKRINEILK